jgi:MscS family membrane protein
MEAIWNTLKNINYSHLPIAKIVIVLVILTLTQTLRRFVIAVVIKTIENFTKKTETDLDDELIAILKPAMSWLILIGGFWLSIVP